MKTRFHFCRSITVASAAGLACAAIAHAQVILQQAVPARAVIQVAPGSPSVAPQPASGANPAASTAQQESQRLQRLKSQTYDRRPSTILKAWKEPEPTKPAEAAPESGPAAEAAKPAEATGEKPADKPAETPAAERPAEGEKPAEAASEPAGSSASDGQPAAEASKDPADPAKPMAEGASAGTAAPADPEAAAKAAAEAAAKAKAETERLNYEMALLQRHVTLGRWSEVKAYLAQLPQEEGKPGYLQMLQSLGSPPQRQQQQIHAPGIGTTTEANVFSVDDLLGLAKACPYALDRKTIQQLGRIVQQTIESGTVIAEIVARLERESKLPDGQAVLSPRQCAHLLMAAGHAKELQPFLPSLNEATESKDVEALNLLARLFMAEHAEQRKPEVLERAWQALQAILALPLPPEKPKSETATAQADSAEEKPEDDPAAQREEALTMAVELAPRIREELGQTWLEESFTREPERGMAILSTIGSMASQALQSAPHAPDNRLKALTLQKTAVEALLKAAPDRANEWQETIQVLARAWLREAKFSRAGSPASSYGPQMRRDVYGNFYYMDEGLMMRQQHEQQARPIAAAQVIEVRPNEDWIARLPESVQPQFAAIFAQLYLHVAEDESAYPYIEKLAASHPELARELAHEFIRVWTRNHDPNASRRYSNPYIFMYGYERKAESIPLTRSKQDRDLVELAGWIKRLRALPLKDLDESLFASAFTTCHSSAEVYRLSAIEEVFGSLDQLQPKTLAELVEKMRQNLTGLWRMPAEQEAQKTRRKQKDIQAEVVRGYRVANSVVDQGLQRFPDDWRLQLAKACLMLDENAYRQEIEPSSEYSHRRLESLKEFQKAAELYAKQVPTLPEDEQVATVFEHWFYAGLGASDLGQIDHKTLPDPRQPPLIRQAIEDLPGETAKKHMGMFANNLFTRASAVKPNVKLRYLRAAFEIVGDHEQAREARKLFDYYKDLVTEIKLVTRIDGSSDVGSEEPFGVFIDLRHTREIERESGGFGRYLQNQNSMSWSYNYGRPLENYRDKFREAAMAVLEEHFDVLSVTFQAEDVHSRADAEYGWRVTPYAYLLLKSKGPQVDKLPALKIDLDFLDTSGHVVLPIESPIVPLNSAKQGPRSVENLQITQTLDERQAGEGKLLLEIKAVARGLIPKLDELLDVRFDGFEVTKIDDQGLGVSRFDPDSDETAIVSERIWTIALAGRKDLAELPKTFAFAAPKDEAAKMEYLRFEDADLASVERVVSLEREYGEVNWPWTWMVVVGAVIGLAMILGIVALYRRRAPAAEVGLQLPETLTPFSVLALLQHIQANNGLSSEQKRELDQSIQRLERHYFAQQAVDVPDLRAEAESWLARTNGSHR